MKFCPTCKTSKPQTVEHWYPARPRKGHKTEGWQSHCRECWKQINKVNKTKRKVNKGE